MPLPKISQPIYEFVIPSTKEKVLFRPFLVKEEKILLTAKISNEKKDVIRAIKQIIENCCVTEGFNTDKLTLFDVEYLFLKLRSISVNNIVKVSYKDLDDGEIYSFEIDLNEIEVKFPENVKDTIRVTDNVYVKMRYPRYNLLESEDFFERKGDEFFELILESIDKIYDEETVYKREDMSKQELEEFVENCSVSAFNEMQQFVANIPQLYHKIEYTNKNGKNRTIEFTSLVDFFSLG